MALALLSVALGAAFAFLDGGWDGGGDAARFLALVAAFLTLVGMVMKASLRFLVLHSDVRCAVQQYRDLRSKLGMLPVPFFG